MSASAISPISVIPENSIILKAISCVPIVGILAQLFSELSIVARIEGQNIPRLIELIDIKNDYKIAGIIRTSVECALAIACMVFEIFEISIILPLVSCACIFLHVYNLTHNQAIIAQIQNQGMPSTSIKIR